LEKSSPQQTHTEDVAPVEVTVVFFCNTQEPSAVSITLDETTCTNEEKKRRKKTVNIFPILNTAQFTLPGHKANNYIQKNTYLYIYLNSVDLIRVFP